MHLESDKVIANISIEELFGYLKDATKLRALMPDNVNKFEPNDNGFTFSIENAPFDIGLIITEKIDNEKVVFQSTKANLDFKLSVFTQALDYNQTSFQAVFDGSFNFLIRAMVEKPLQKFLNDLAEKFASV